jgi:hypothetical protein
MTPKVKAMMTNTPKALPATAAPPDRSQPALLAKAALDPRVSNATLIQTYATQLGQQDFWALAGALRADMLDLAAGKTQEIEAMLYGQAQALQAIFVNLAKRADSQDQMRSWESLMRLALKAQGQSRATLEALAEIRNPRQVAFVRQANIAHGAQQVNNSSASEHEGPPATEASAPAKSSKTVASELLEVQGGERLDFSATRKAGASDSGLAPVGAFHRTTDA